MHWEVYGDKAKQLKAIADEVKQADRLILATDPDREGEAISWHLLEVLKARKALPKGGVQRVTFNENTKSADSEAMPNPRELDREMIDAYLARRALDYLVGFTLSPVLWRKLPGAKSAGRVQSVALRLICDRELEVERFVAREYWSIDGLFTNAAREPFTARLVSWQGRKLDKFDLADEAQAMAAKAAVEAGRYTIQSVEQKPVMRNPWPPFITSTLQQEAARSSASPPPRPCRSAAYEGVSMGLNHGLITYMRTDGVTLSQEAIASARQVIAAQFGNAYLPEKPRTYTTKAKNAQEAHEAIRPTDLRRTPGDVAHYLSTEQARLYELIWKRTLASQMSSARMERTTAEIVSADQQVVLRATGQVVAFAGFLAVYDEGRDDAEDEESRRLPKLTVGGPRRWARCAPNSTSPPRRRAIPKPRWSSGWRSWASAGRPPTPRSCRRCATAPMCGWRRTAFTRKRRAGWSPPSWRSSSSATSNMISPPTWKASSTRFPPASWTGRTCCGPSGPTSSPRPRKSWS